MDLIDRPVKPKAKAPRASVQQPKEEGVFISMTVGGGNAKQIAEATKRLSALSRRVKVGKRLGATQAIRAERE